MGLTKQYLAYRAVDSFNIITSGRSNVNFLIHNNIEGRYIVCGAAENAIIWDLRLDQRVATLRRDKQEVTAVRASPDRIHIAVGYADGVVEIFDVSSKASVCTLALHRSAISILRYDSAGLRLVSGSLDTELVVVDIIEQAGKQRLVGHNAPITDAHFLERLQEDDILVTSSKDTQIKFWNLETQYCFKTILDNRTEVWALAFAGNLMIAGSGESGMNVYRLMRKDEGAAGEKTIEAAVEGLSIDDEDMTSPFSVTNCGVIQRAGKGRTVNLVVDPTERVLSCHGTNDLIENFYICNESEAKQRLAKRLKKAKKAQESSDNKNEEDNEELNKELSLSDEIRRLESIKVKQKIKSIDVLLSRNDELRVLASLANNSLQLYSIEAISTKHKHTDTEETVKSLRGQSLLGHQSEVRTVCFSSDSLVIGSGAGDSFKLWHLETLSCLRTAPADYVLCSCFVPGDRYVLVGLKSGKLLIVDVGTADIIEEIPAHENELWTVSLLPDLKGCVTGSSDTTVKIWTFELIDSQPQTPEQVQSPVKVLSLLHKNTLKLEETVLCARVSPNMKYLAVGLLDSTVKVFFLDSFKFFLSLYGHKLPVLCLDISYDSTLIATGSADRNVKIWGLDFGDCHRSLFAHDDSVMALQFIPKTHMIFTCGKDGKIKQWDGDTFDKILTLPGHIGECYNLAVSSNGKYLVTCGSDRTIRLFERTDEPIVLQDVQEEEREEMENQQLATGEDNSVPLLPGLKMPSRKTIGSEKAVESILECLEISKKFDADVADGDKPELHPLMRALKVEDTDAFLIEVLARIRPSDMEEALLLLPFTNVCELLERLPRLIENCCDEIELICKVTIFLFKVHLKPITSAKHLKPLLQKIIQGLKADITELRDVIGMNIYGMQLMQREIEERNGVEVFRDATKERKKREKKKQQAQKRVNIQMN